MSERKRELKVFPFYFVCAPKEPEPEAICGVESLRKALDVSCKVAIIVTVVIGK